MPRKLITILGKARQGGDYASTRYDFGDGEPCETKYFGLALQQHLQSDTLIVLGTRGCLQFTHSGSQAMMHPKRTVLR